MGRVGGGTGIENLSGERGVAHFNLRRVAQKASTLTTELGFPRFIVCECDETKKIAWKAKAEKTPRTLGYAALSANSSCV